MVLLHKLFWTNSGYLLCIKLESRSREFYIVTPENFSIDQNLPLLISLHGGDDYADANMEYTGFKTIKDK